MASGVSAASKAGGAKTVAMQLVQQKSFGADVKGGGKGASKGFAPSRMGSAEASPEHSPREKVCVRERE